MGDRPWPLNFTPSAWHDPLDEVVSSLMGHYNAGVPRADLSAVRRLMEAVAPARPRNVVVVVGTNGKTSTATFLTRLLSAAGRTTGLYTSPHLRFWTERILIDGEPIDAGTFERTLTRVDAVAESLTERPGDIRFFDVLTIVAEDVFGRAPVDVGVFEAGIGGRLDATRCLEAPLVLLTSIGRDHEALLGHSPVERLREKALAVAPGGTILASPLGPELESELPAIAAEAEARLEIVDAPPGTALGLPAYQAANLALAEAALAHLGIAPGAVSADHLDLEVDGRFSRGSARGVSYVADVAHNPTAWTSFLESLPERPHVVLCAITEPRDPGDLVAALTGHRARLGEVVVTSTTVRPSQDAGRIAQALRAEGIDARAVPRPETAFEMAVEAARRRGEPLAVFGSNYLVVDFLAWEGGAHGVPNTRA